MTKNFQNGHNSRGVETTSASLPDAVAAWVKMAQKTPLLTAVEEKELGRRIAEGDEEAYQKMVEANKDYMVEVRSGQEFDKARHAAEKALEEIEGLFPQVTDIIAGSDFGQDAVKIAQGFDQRLNVTGVVLTKMDGDARGGAALSIYGVTKKPIKYIGVGEKTDALEEFYPERMAGRILQQGDIVSLVEKAQGVFDADEAKRMEKKVRKEGMDLTDFLTAMKQIEKLGPLEGLLKMMPGVNSKMLKQAKAADPKRMKHLEAIVLSMTLEERKNPSLMNGTRRSRVAKGSGRTISEVNRLLEQFREMQKMMKKATAAPQGGKSKPNMFGMRH